MTEQHRADGRTAKLEAEIERLKMLWHVEHLVSMGFLGEIARLTGELAQAKVIVRAAREWAMAREIDRTFGNSGPVPAVEAAQLREIFEDAERDLAAALARPRAGS